MFFENLLMSAGHELKNRYMHIDYDNQSAIQSENGKRNGKWKVLV